MNKKKNFIKISVNSLPKIQLSNNNEQDSDINKRKLLSKVLKINKSSTNLENEKIKLHLTENNQSDINEKTQGNIKLKDKLDIIKKIKQSKEKKDIERIYQKWNKEQLLLNTKNNINKEYLEKSYESKNKPEIKKIILNNKNSKDNSNKESSEKQSQLMIDKIKQLKKEKEKENEKNNVIKQVKKQETKIKKELNNIYQNSYLFFDKKNESNEDFIEKLEYIIRVEKYIIKEIKYNKNNNLILPNEAINYKDNVVIKFLGYFGSELSLQNINVFIEINPTNEMLRDITFKIITSGLATQKIYKIILNDDKYKNEFNENIQKWFIFLKDIKRRIIYIYHISEKNIYFFNYNLYKFEAYLLIYNEKINNLEKILKNYNINVTVSTLMNNIILSPNMFDGSFSKNEDEWPTKNLVRGQRKYYPPYGCIGIALKIKNKYDKNNDLWFGKNNKDGEWPVAYHGVGKGNVFNKVLNIINDNLKKGPTQLYSHYFSVESNKDIYNFCGEGVYLSQNIEKALTYADIIKLGGYNLKFKFVIMARVNPHRIRSPGGIHNDWILNGNDEEIRPYRLLVIH